MSIKYIPASYERNEYEKAVFTEAIVYSFDLLANTPVRLTNQSWTTFNFAAGLAANGTRIQFDTLEGNLPWSSYTKNPITLSRTTTPPIPSGSLPPSGGVTIIEGNVSEVVYYGSITWTSQTAGYLNNVKRTEPDNVFTAAAVGVFSSMIPVRERIVIFNRTGGTLYIGHSENINATNNSAQLPQGGEWGIWLEPLQHLYVYSVAGTVRSQDTYLTVAEYR
jgi:hypothetical protein